MSSITAIGHAVLKVTNLERSVAFYRDVLGLKEVARYQGRMVFFSFGTNHHDLALLELGASAPPPVWNQVGLYHLAFKVGDSLDELREFKVHLERHAVAIRGMTDHRVSQSLYLTDPDGIEIEVFVDTDPNIWKNDPSAVATIRPLTL
jgi:catechol 2,3-dioxygenase